MMYENEYPIEAERLHATGTAKGYEEQSEAVLLAELAKLAKRVAAAETLLDKPGPTLPGPIGEVIVEAQHRPMFMPDNSHAVRRWALREVLDQHASEITSLQGQLRTVTAAAEVAMRAHTEASAAAHDAIAEARAHLQRVSVRNSLQREKLTLERGAAERMRRDLDTARVARERAEVERLRAEMPPIMQQVADNENLRAANGRLTRHNDDLRARIVQLESGDDRRRYVQSARDHARNAERVRKELSAAHETNARLRHARETAEAERDLLRGAINTAEEIIASGTCSDPEHTAAQAIGKTATRTRANLRRARAKVRAQAAQLADIAAIAQAKP